MERSSTSQADGDPTHGGSTPPHSLPLVILIEEHTKGPVSPAQLAKGLSVEHLIPTSQHKSP